MKLQDFQKNFLYNDHMLYAVFYLHYFSLIWILKELLIRIFFSIHWTQDAFHYWEYVVLCVDVLCSFFLLLYFSKLRDCIIFFEKFQWICETFNLQSNITVKLFSCVSSFYLASNIPSFAVYFLISIMTDIKSEMILFKYWLYCLFQKMYFKKKFVVDQKIFPLFVQVGFLVFTYSRPSSAMKLFSNCFPVSSSMFML